jgi:hypothetical protein
MSQAFQYPIGANGETSINSSSPGWMLTILSWQQRDTYREDANQKGDYIETFPTLVVRSDCVALDIVSSKTSMTGGMSCTLKGADINYSQACSPGDFIFVNILNFDSDFATTGLENRARTCQQINKSTDGFKGMYKIQRISKTITIEPSSGIKTLFYKIEGFSFTEFNNVIYFNPYLISTTGDGNKPLGQWQASLGDRFNKQIANNAFGDVGTLISALVHALIGDGMQPSDATSTNYGNFKASQNQKYELPSEVASLLHVPGAKYAADVIYKVIGIQNYTKTNTDIGMAAGFNGYGAITNDGFLSQKLLGSVFISAAYWNCVTVASILSQYLNNNINEMYTTFRVNNKGDVRPTLVVRQYPYSTNTDKLEGIPKTKFLNIPRWVISPDLIYSIDVGKEESLRFNFVQVFGNTAAATVDGSQHPASIADQIAYGNFQYSEDDIKRHGLRPRVLNANYMLPQDVPLQVQQWSKLISDWTIGGEQKFNGNCTTLGISEPCCPGDNFQVGTLRNGRYDSDNIVYHIESIHHSCQITPNGIKTFRTTLQLSNGIVDTGTTATTVSFPENGDTFSALDELKQDRNNGTNILPGYTDVEYVAGRPGGERQRNPKRQPNLPKSLTGKKGLNS